MATATNGKPAEVKTTEVKVNLRDDETCIIAHKQVESHIARAFEIQDAYDNASKFGRAFVFDAILAQLKLNARQTVNQWETLVDKASRKRPTSTREQVIAEILESKKVQELHERASVAAGILQMYK